MPRNYKELGFKLLDRSTGDVLTEDIHSTKWEAVEAAREFGGSTKVEIVMVPNPWSREELR